MKNFNKNGISTLIRKLSKGFSVKSFMLTYYRKLGVFIDVRCHDVQSIASLLSAVRLILTDLAKFQIFNILISE